MIARQALRWVAETELIPYLTIRGALKFDATDWTASTTLTLELLDPSGIRLGAKVFHQGDQGEFIAVDAAATGFHTFRIQATNTPATNSKPSYTLETTYQAPTSFLLSSSCDYTISVMSSDVLHNAMMSGEAASALIRYARISSQRK